MQMSNASHSLRLSSSPASSAPTAGTSAETSEEKLGVVVRGSLREGLSLRLDETMSVEDLRVGSFVVVRGDRNRYFAMLSDIRLDVTNQGVLLDPPKTELARRVLQGTSVFGTVELKPMLMTPNDAAEDDEDSLLPVKTVPTHFSPVFEATREDVGRIFGDEARGDTKKFFEIGQPLDMDTPVCLNLDRFVERSNAIFGKSGTGKTFLTRICLCGVIKANKAVNLIFDMHSEYGHQGTSEGNASRTVRGLKQYFGSRVQVFTLDEASSRRRKVSADFTVKIPYASVTVEDIALLSRELNLSSTAVETGDLLENRFGANWMSTFLEMDSDAIKEFVLENNAHGGALTAFQRKLKRFVRQCEGFLKPTVPGDDDAVRHIMECLLKGVNVVLEFGQFDNPVQYMLVANLLTRRIHDEYRQLVEKAQGDGGEGPKPLVITIEEAHKFLSPALSDQTIFGTIARELRKYKVTLLIVDQRPSGIDDEVLSQVGTKICCLLDDEKDVDAVLTGVSGANSLRNVLASLETKQQAMLFGHAVPMPVVIRTRHYDDDDFKSRVSDLEASLHGSDDTAKASRKDWLADKLGTEW